MPDSLTHVYIHIVWMTYERRQLISPGIETRLYAEITRQCEDLHTRLIALGGTEAHIHVLVRLHPVVSIAHLVKNMKGASSHFASRQIPGASAFRWQGDYGAFSVDLNQISTVRSYIHRQKEHHAAGTIWPLWEQVESLTRDHD